MAAYGVIMYVNFIFISLFIGYAVGTAPIISFHYGAGNEDELKNLRKKSMTLVAVLGFAMLALSEALAYPLTKLFVGYDADLFDLTLRGFMLYSVSFAVCGLNIFASSFFTALGDGVTSAAISFLRTLVFQLIVLLTLPLLLDTDGIWLAIVVAEVLAFGVSAWLMKRKQKRYGY